MSSMSEFEDVILNNTSHVIDPIGEVFLDSAANLGHLLSGSERLVLDPVKTVPIWSQFILVSLVSLLFIWRLWTFTVRPWLNPDEPKEIPYWTPCKSRVEETACDD